MNVRFAVRSLAAMAVGLSLVSGFAAEGFSLAHRPLLRAAEVRDIRTVN